jgi:hypothetical protein
MLIGLMLIAFAARGEFPVPAHRLADWTLCGIPGGISTNAYTTVINVTQAPYNADNTGAAEASHKIQDALNAATANTVVYLPAGLYLVSTTLLFRTSDVLILGDGPLRSFIKWGSDRTNNNVFYVQPTGYSFDYTASTSYRLTNGLEQGSTNLGMDNNDFTAGDIVLIDEIGNGVEFDRFGSSGTATWTGRTNGLRSKGQLVKVLTRTSTSFTFTPPLAINYTTNQIAHAVRQNATLWRVGFQGLSVSNSITTDGNGSARDMVEMSGCAECFWKDVELFGSKRRLFWVYGCYRPEFQGLYMHHGQGAEWSNPGYGPDRAYGFYTGLQTTGGLWWDNIGWKLHFLFAYEGPGPYNVIAYNYSTNVQFNNGETTQPSSGNHAAGSHFNLWEGNIFLSYILFDTYFGNSLASTIYRNLLQNEPLGGIDYTTNREQYMSILNFWGGTGPTNGGSYSNNVVGNLLGRRGVEIYYEAPDGVSVNPGVNPFNRHIWRLGNTNANHFEYTAEGDARVKNSLIRALNWDSVTVTNDGVVLGGTATTNDLPHSLWITEVEFKRRIGVAEGWDTVGGIGPHVGTNGNAIFLPARERMAAININGPTNYLTRRIIDRGTQIRGIRRLR